MKQEEKIAIGDVVKLKSGGPLMTVGVADGDLCSVHWFDDNGQFHSEMVAWSALTKL